MLDQDKQHKVANFIVRFICGAALGLLIAVSWLQGPAILPWWLVLSVTPLVAGILVALTDGRVFEWLKWWSWRPTPGHATPAL